MNTEYILARVERARQLEAEDRPADALEVILPFLPEGSMNFGSSLRRAALGKRGMTPKQRMWVPRLIDQVEKAAKPAPEPEPVADLSAVHRMFDTAGGKLKRPALVFHVAHRNIRLNRTTTGRFPGAIYIVDRETSTWVARIHTNNTLERNAMAERNHDLNPLIAQIGPFLEQLAFDPVRVAAEHGKLTGSCCFCNLPLGHGKDKRSIAVGYGPVCAKKWGLEWGIKEEAA